MFKIDMHSLLLIMAINKLLLGFMMFYVKKHAPNIKGIDFWAYGSLFTAAGLIIYAFFPHPASLWVDFSFSLFLNIFILLGDTMFLTGFLFFKGKPLNKMLLYGFPLLSALNVIVFTIFIPVLWVRFSLNALLGTLLYVISAIEMRKSPKKSLQALFTSTSNLYIFFAFLQLTRGTLGIIYKPENPVESSVASILLLGIAGILLILLTYNLILIIYKSINEELNEQIATKNKLYSIVAHDLRGPLSSIINYNTILTKSIDTWDTDKVKGWLSDMNKMSTSSAFLLENLFQWSSTQLHEIQLKCEKKDISKIINESVSFVANQAAMKNIHITYCNNEAAIGYFDSNMIAIVVRNLLNNAIKFTHLNGKVNVSVVDKVNEIEVFVTDNGVGIERDKLQIIFDTKEMFSTPGTAHEHGSGFGLLICKEFIELHKGNISVVSVPDNGSVFSFTLPKNELT